MSAKSVKRTKPTTIDDYLAPLSDDKRVALERLRRTILDAAPGAEEAISYQLPGFRLDGRWLLWIGAAANHCAIYGVERSSLEGLDEFETSGKGTVRFHPERPLPDALVREIVRARIAKNAERKERMVAGVLAVSTSRPREDV